MKYHLRKNYDASVIRVVENITVNLSSMKVTILTAKSRILVLIENDRVKKVAPEGDTIRPVRITKAHSL